MSPGIGAARRIVDRRAEPAGRQTQWAIDLGPHRLFPRCAGDPFDGGADDHVVGVAVFIDALGAARRCAQHPLDDGRPLLGQGSRIVSRRQKEDHAQGGRVLDPGPVAHEVADGRPIPAWIDRHAGKQFAQGCVPLGSALFDQPREQGRRHRLGVRPKMPAVIERRRIVPAEPAHAPDPGPGQPLARHNPAGQSDWGQSDRGLGGEGCIQGRVISRRSLRCSRSDAQQGGCGAGSHDVSTIQRHAIPLPASLRP